VNKKIWAFLLVLLLLFPIFGCKKTSVQPSEGLLGTWKDASGLTEYQFESGGKLKLKALNVGSFRGTYRMNGDHITIHYRVLGKDVDDTYTFRLEGNTLYLDNNEFTRRK
jgi:hypothetical protein